MRARWLPVLALGACTPSFENPTTVRDLRVLAIVAEPPEILVDQQDPTASLAPVMVRPFVVDPRGPGRTVSFTVRACGNQQATSERGRDQGPGRPRDTLAQSACPASAPLVHEGSSAVAEDGTVPFEFTFMPTAELLTAALQVDPLGAVLGLPITLSFDVRAGDEQIVAYKRVIFSPRLDPDQKPNANPKPAEISHRRRREEMPVPLDPQSPPVVDLGDEIRLFVTKRPEDIEAYKARVASQEQRTILVEEVPRETLRAAFFATKGTFSPGTVDTNPSPVLDNPVTDLESIYTAPETLAAGDGPDVDVFVVLRDERGGASVTRTKLRLRAP